MFTAIIFFGVGYFVSSYKTEFFTIVKNVKKTVDKEVKELAKEKKD